MLGRLFRRLEPFLYSRRNIVGSVLALGGVALFLSGLIGGLTWLPIVGGLYLIGYLLIPGEPALDLHLDAAGDVAEVQKGLDRLLREVRGRIADDLYGRVSSIRDAIMMILRTDDAAAGAGDPNIYLIRQTALDYLPAALSAYLAVPRLYAERRPVAGGRTPHDVLLEQLALMDDRMQDVLEGALRHDSDKLLAQGRFIAEKFAPSALSLELPTDEVVEVPATISGTGTAADRTATETREAASREGLRANERRG